MRQETPRLRPPRWPSGLVPWRKSVEQFLERLAAAVGVQLEIPGAKRSQGGDALTFEVPSGGVASASTPWSITRTGKILPGLIGGRTPTLAGQPLNTTSNVLTLSGTYVVWFKLTFTVTYTETYLSAWSLTSVIVETGSSVPSDTASVKHLPFNNVTAGVPGSAYFDRAIVIALGDAGPNATELFYAA